MKPLSQYIEESNNITKYYRGYDIKKGIQKNHLLWLTDDLEYAKSYGDAVIEYDIDESKLNGCIDDLPDGVDYYKGPSIEDCKTLIKKGFNSYGFYANDDESWCICLWDNKPIIKTKKL